MHGSRLTLLAAFGLSAFASGHSDLPAAAGSADVPRSVGPDRIVSRRRNAPTRALRLPRMAPALHSRALINDPRSHGTIGDRLLSLREAILMTNRVIDENALSAEELAQLSGFGNDIAFADIDAQAVPVLTFERDLP